MLYRSVDIDLGMLGLIEADVAYSIEGKHYPATESSPEEFPVYDICRVEVPMGIDTVDIKDQLDEQSIDAIIESIKNSF